jgi:THO complex subunit 7
LFKKFNAYSALAFGPSATQSSVDDAREAFLVELSLFSLQLKKAAMVCDAEKRQVEEYQLERQRIGAQIRETVKQYLV